VKAWCRAPFELVAIADRRAVAGVLLPRCGAAKPRRCTHNDVYRLSDRGDPGQRSDYDRIMLDVKTDGLIGPRAALSEAAKTLV